jgi:hypothetical protein
MRKRWIVPLSVALFGIAATGSPSQVAAGGLPLPSPSLWFEVVPRESDPGRTYLVQAQWLTGIGCPTNARLATPNDDFTDWSGTYRPYTDPACPKTASPFDPRNEGLLLAKTGPTISNFASAVADIKGVEGQVLTELGYDIRKPGIAGIADPRGSWCGAGAPRFNIETTVDSYFLACASPPPSTQMDGDGFVRLTWGGVLPLVAYDSAFVLGPVMGEVIRLSIVFDEGTTLGSFPPTDAADHVELGFGLAVLDNINVNGVRVGKGPGHGDDDEDGDHDDDGDSPKHCKRCHDHY